MNNDDDHAPTPFEPAQICARIEEMLNVYDWSWAELAKKAGVCEKTLHRWRTGRSVPQILGLRYVAEALALNYEELIHGLRRRLDPPNAPALEPPASLRRAYDPWKFARDGIFVGRQSTMQSLLELLERRQSANVVGDRRIGKSSVLRTWAQRARARGYTVVSVSGETTAGRTARALVQAITGAEAPEDPDGAANALGAWLSAQRRNGAPPIVLVDEFDDLALHIDNRFFQRLRGMVGDEMVVLVLATCRHLGDLCPPGHTSPFDDLLSSEQLGLLEPEAADALLRLRPDTLAPEDPDLLRRWSGRHPFYVKLLVHYLVRARLEGRTSDHAVEMFCGHAARTLHKLWLVHLDLRDQTTLRNLVRGEPVAAKVVRRLRLRGLLTEEGKPFGEVLTRWLEELT